MLKLRRLIAMALAAVLVLSLPTVAWATIEEDQNSLSDEEIAAAIAGGEVDTTIEEGPEQISTYSNGGSLFTMFSGADRYEVASMEARAAYGQVSRALIVGGEAWPDSLTSAGLAGVWDCPILLTERGNLTAATRSALSDLKVSQVTVVGGPNSVSENVLAQIRAMGISAERIGGADRYEVQMAIYNKVADSWGGDLVFIASGEKYADALSMSPAAFKTKAPIFLVDASGNLSASQKTQLQQGVSEGRYSRFVIAGGPASVSSDTENFARGLASGNFTRFSGADRYEVATMAATWFVSNHILSWDNVAIASGITPFDALCGSVLQGKRGAVMLLVEPGNDSRAISGLKANKVAINHLSIFGGKATITSAIRMDIADVFGIPYSQIPGFRVYIDAGHGWNNSNNGVWDSGAVGSGYKEADLTVDLANRLNNILRNQYGIDTYLNTDGGWYKLRHAEAVQQGCDVIVSIHFNSGGGTGSETLIHNTNANWRSAGLQDALHPRLIAGVGLRDRGQKTQQVAILSGQLPATLLEVGFIDNSGDMSQYQQRKDQVAQQIAQGIVEW